MGKKALSLILVLGIIIGMGSIAKGEAQTKDIVAQMTLREKLGQLLVLDLRKWEGQPQTELNDECGQVIRDYGIGGVCLFASNLKDPGQIVILVDAMQRAAKIPLLMAIDEEGGYITRLGTIGTILPGNMALGVVGDLELTKKAGRVKGEEVAALGFNVNFAPVVDVNTNIYNPVAGVRSFGDDPAVVGQMGMAFINGLLDAGVAGCVKHFPGYGNIGSNISVELVTVPGTKEELMATDILPFKMAIENGVDMIMTAHVAVPGLDDTQITSTAGEQKNFTVPATFSKKIITDLLRKELGFNGLIVTDALAIGAIRDHFSIADRVYMAIMAGADVPLLPIDVFGQEDLKENIGPMFEELEKRALEEPAFRARVEESALRVIEFKQNRGILSSNWTAILLDERIETALNTLRSQEHLAIEKEIGEKAVTIAKNQGDIIPFALQSGDKVCVLAPFESYVNHGERAIKGDVEAFAYDIGGITDEMKASMDKADYIVIMSTIVDADGFDPFGESENSKLTAGALAAWEYTKEKGYLQHTAGLSLSLPYELMITDIPLAMVNTYCRQQNAAITIYQSALEVIFGQ